MKLSILVLPIILAQGYAENQILKRNFVGAADNLFGLAGNSLDNVFGGSFDNAVAGASDVAGSVGSNVAGDVGNVAHRPSTLIGKQITHAQFFSEIDGLLSAGKYSRAKSLLDNFDITSDVHHYLVGLALRKGDDSFLVSVINSKPRSVLSDLKLMKYIRETSDPERANYFLKAIANNMGDTVGIGNNRKNAYYDLGVRMKNPYENYDLAEVIQRPYEKALQLAKKFNTEARSPVEKKAWGEITQYIQAYSVRVSPFKNFFNLLEMALKGNHKNAAEMLLTNIHKFPIHDYFKVLTDIILKGDKDLISYVFSKGTIRRSAIADAEFMKLAREIHPGSRGEELSLLIGKEIPAQRRREAMEHAYSKFIEARNANNIDETKLWEATAHDFF